MKVSALLNAPNRKKENQNLPLQVTLGYHSRILGYEQGIGLKLSH